MRSLPGAVLAALLLLTAACTPATPSSTTTTGADTPSDPDVTTSTIADEPGRPGPIAGPQAPPETPDPTEVADDAITTPEGYSIVDDTDLFTDDAAFAIGTWLPDAVVAGTARRVVVDPLGDRILVVSLVPTMRFRADPTLVPVLADLDADGTEVSAGVHRTETDSGLTLHLWSDGDGVLITASLADAAGRAYLEARERDREPLPIWPLGTCLYFDPDDGLPWAPVVLDAVVPCDGPTNAEVIASQQVAAGLDRYDDDAITLQRNLECDRAYEEAIGPQRDHAPSLITYMPDRDEFDRGDRYLACVIQLEAIDGPRLVTGRISDRDDLVWSPRVGECFAAGLAPDPVDCGDPHRFEFVGEVEFDGDAWPIDAASLAAACEPVLAELTEGPAPVDVFPMGLYPHAFERGERSVRCMAFARTDTGPARVIGSFRDEWRILATDGVEA